MLTYQITRVLISMGVSFLFAIIITPIAFKILEKYGAKKQIRTSKSAPIFYKLHEWKGGTPTMGGVIIWFSVLCVAAFFYIIGFFFNGFFHNLNFISRSQTYLPMAAFVIAASIGLVDDILGMKKIGPNGGGLPVRFKLFLYTIIGTIGAYWFYVKLGWTTLYVPFVGNIEIDGFYIPFFIFIIVSTAFSANETDGLDGLLGGVSLFAFGSLSVVAFFMGRFDLAVFSSVVVGALLAFLWFNIYPAKFFMGDTGSMSLGITIGTIAMLTNTALFLPFFALVLVIESVSVILQIFSKKILKKKIFLSTPIHHHFEAIGWHESRVTMRFWIISAVSSGLGLVLFFLSKMIK